MNLKGLKYLLSIGFLLSSINGSAENFISNGGFEGSDGIEVVPPDWAPGCGVMNTPDTQPGWWNVENKPHGGDTYLDLLYKEDGTQESVFQKLANPLPKGSCFLIEIFLAQACQDSLSDLYPFGLNNPGDLVVRGSDVYGCDNGQILAVFKQVSNCDWRPFYAVFQANMDIRYIYLEFDKGSSTSKDGSILIDDFTLDYTSPLPLHEIIVPYGETAFLQATLEGESFNWTIDSLYLENDSSSQQFSVLANYEVEVNYLSTDSCLVFENWQILVEPLVPNGFTPLNPDGVNDVFYINGLAEPSHLIISNRWGSLVYENSNYLNDWSPQGISPGVYYYTLHFLTTNRYFIGAVSIF